MLVNHILDEAAVRAIKSALLLFRVRYLEVWILGFGTRKVSLPGSPSFVESGTSIIRGPRNRVMIVTRYVKKLVNYGSSAIEAAGRVRDIGEFLSRADIHATNTFAVAVKTTS